MKIKDFIEYSMGIIFLSLIFGSDVQNINDYEEILISKDSTYSVKDLVGKVYNIHQLPNEFNNNGGGVISDFTKQSDLRLWVTRFELDSLTIIILQKMLFRDSSGSPYWKILDVLNISDMKNNELFVFPSMASIILDGKPTWETVGIGSPDKKGFIKKFRKVWKVLPSNEKFQEISPESFSCQLEGCSY